MLLGGRPSQATKEEPAQGQAFHTANKGGERKHCAYCNRSGHAETQCWQKNSQLKPRSKNQGRRGNQRRRGNQATKKETSPGGS
eukprot:11255777-Prorocentrum_lima.AAC.1